MFLWVIHAPILMPPCPKGTGYQCVKISSDLYMRANSMRNSSQILHGDQPVLFWRVDHATSLAKFCYDKNTDALPVD